METGKKEGGRDGRMVGWRKVRGGGGGREGGRDGGKTG